MTSPEKVESQLYEIITAVLGSAAPKSIGLADELPEIGVDSLTILEIVVRIEQECGIEIGDSEVFAVPLRQVSDLVQLVQTHVGNS
ncbi:acyl carrier protein [Streptomyces sp. HSW2009]|uniref:acyl carrier protein n=1 Tax=Streptomyces sp. HSW2009 TaxID=3142890 RepID=UPI0032EFF946